MKKTVWLRSLCVLLLILCACDNTAPTQAALPTASLEPAATPEPATATPVPEPATPTETDLPVQADTETAAGETEPDKYAPYRELIENVTKGLTFGWSETAQEELGVSDIFKRTEEHRLGWIQLDINGDGTDELLFGEIAEDGEGSPIYDVFTLLGGQLLHPATGWEFNRWYLVEGGKLINEMSSTGYDVTRSAFGFFNGALVPARVWADRSEYLHLALESFDAPTA